MGAKNKDINNHIQPDWIGLNLDQLTIPPMAAASTPVASGQQGQKFRSLGWVYGGSLRVKGCWEATTPAEDASADAGVSSFSVESTILKVEG